MNLCRDVTMKRLFASILTRVLRPLIRLQRRRFPRPDAWLGGVADARACLVMPRCERRPAETASLGGDIEVQGYAVDKDGAVSNVATWDGTVESAVDTYISNYSPTGTIRVNGVAIGPESYYVFPGRVDPGLDVTVLSSDAYYLIETNGSFHTVDASGATNVTVNITTSLLDTYSLQNASPPGTYEGGRAFYGPGNVDTVIAAGPNADPDTYGLAIGARGDLGDVIGNGVKVDGIGCHMLTGSITGLDSATAISAATWLGQPGSKIEAVRGIGELGAYGIGADVLSDVNGQGTQNTFVWVRQGGISGMLDLGRLTGLHSDGPVKQVKAQVLEGHVEIYGAGAQLLAFAQAQPAPVPGAPSPHVYAGNDVETLVLDRAPRDKDSVYAWVKVDGMIGTLNGVRTWVEGNIEADDIASARFTASLNVENVIVGFDLNLYALNLIVHNKTLSYFGNINLEGGNASIKEVATVNGDIGSVNFRYTLRASLIAYNGNVGNVETRDFTLPAGSPANGYLVYAKRDINRIQLRPASRFNEQGLEIISPRSSLGGDPDDKDRLKAVGLIVARNIGDISVEGNSNIATARIVTGHGNIGSIKCNGVGIKNPINGFGGQLVSTVETYGGDIGTVSAYQISNDVIANRDDKNKNANIGGSIHDITSVKPPKLADHVAPVRPVTFKASNGIQQITVKENAADADSPYVNFNVMCQAGGSHLPLALVLGTDLQFLGTVNFTYNPNQWRNPPIPLAWRLQFKADDEVLKLTDKSDFSPWYVRGADGQTVTIKSAKFEWNRNLGAIGGLFVDPPAVFRKADDSGDLSKPDGWIITRGG